MDKLESDKVKIIIQSRDIEVKASGHRTKEELQFFAGAMMVALNPQRAIQTTITDKLLEQHFATLRSNTTSR